VEYIGLFLHYLWLVEPHTVFLMECMGVFTCVWWNVCYECFTWTI